MSDGRPGSDADGPARSDALDDSDDSDESSLHPPASVSSTEPNVAGGDDVHASEVEGKQYRGTWYLPLRYEELEEFDDLDGYPEPGKGGSFRLADPSRVPRAGHVVGPSAIILGTSPGSDETPSWPVLTAQYGWAVFWAFVVGIFTQSLISTELQHQALATGESVFRAFARVGSYWPWALLVSRLINLDWPRWAAGMAQVVTAAFGFDGTVALFGASLVTRELAAAVLMDIIWLSYQVSSTIYGAVEVFQISLLFVVIGVTLLLVAVTGSWVEFADLPAAAGSVGTSFEGSDIAVFLGGLVFTGADGCLDLSQSLWM